MLRWDSTMPIWLNIGLTKDRKATECGLLSVHSRNFQETTPGALRYMTILNRRSCSEDNGPLLNWKPFTLILHPPSPPTFDLASPNLAAIWSLTPPPTTLHLSHSLFSFLCSCTVFISSSGLVCQPTDNTAPCLQNSFYPEDGGG